MKFLIIAMIISPLTVLGVNIESEQLKFNETKLGLESDAVGEWATTLKGKVNSYMLDDKSRFGEFLKRNGDMTDSERHLLSYNVEVRPVESLNNVYAALFYSRLHMNKTLIRSSIYNDGGPGVEKGVLPPRNAIFLQESMEAARGLNLKGGKVKEFYDLAKKSDYSLYEEEIAFEPILDKLMEKHPDGNFYLISFNIVGLSLDTFGHEINHALYETNPTYKKIINDFWKNTLSDSEKSAVTKALGSIYDGEQVIIDEFQAYLLQPIVPAAQSSMLPVGMVQKYQNELIDKLQKANAPVAFAPSCESYLE